MFTEDLVPFLADFSQSCSAGAVQFMGLLDQPDELMQMQRGTTLRASAHSSEYELTYATAHVTLTRGLPVTVAGIAYSVREAPRQIDDGVFSVVTLSRT
jgi:hypothetical protein